MDIMFLLTYVIYCLAIVGSIYLFTWVHLKLETIRLKHRLLQDLMEKGYETDNIDLDKFLNNK